ncbi:MAG: hypothetical protein NUW01_13830 [Gemmatimonadaceae bacterium]|nr:hypothetical protein [Gemmatimonadaceae bacterium]
MANRKIQVEIIGDASSLQRAFGKAGQQGSSFGDKLNKASKIATVGLLGMAVGAKKLSDDASGLNESINATNVVFGDAAKKLQDFSKIAATEAGLSMRDFNELVTPVGAALQNVGFSADEAADASVSLAKRAADMASVFNVDVSEALSAIQSGLRGEADPLERFGVGLSDAAVKAQAMTMGLAKSEAALTANDKAQARLALLMKQTDRVAGDFKNTSDQLANSQRINAAEAENQRAKFGQGLLPVMEKLQGVQRSLTTFMGEHSTATTVGTLAIAGLAAAVIAVNAAMKVATATTAVFTTAQRLLNTAVGANPFVRAAIVLAALVAGLIVAYQTSETFRNIVTGVFNAVRDTVATVISAILTGVDKFLAGLQMMAQGASKLPFVGDKFKGVAEAVGNAREKVQGLQSAINGLKSKDITVTTTINTIRHEQTISGGARGGRAHGGPVSRGVPYYVGEEGKELFVPNTNGQIIPNGGRGGGSGGGAPPVIVNVYGWVGTDQDIARKIITELNRYGNRGGALTVGSA